MSSKCGYILMPSNMIEVVKGTLMGDGSIDTKSSKNPNLIVVNTKKEYLDFLDNLFGQFSRGVRLYKSAEKSAKGEYIGSNNPENYSDIYAFKTMSHPQLSTFSSWYDDSGKTFPSNLKLTPTSLKHWFTNDGTYDTSGSQDRILIAASNELENEGKLRSYFKDANIPEFSTFNTSKRKSGGYRVNLIWTKDDSQELFKYMGNPLPGFEYKWPERFK